MLKSDLLGLWIMSIPASPAAFTISNTTTDNHSQYTTDTALANTLTCVVSYEIKKHKLLLKMR